MSGDMERIMREIHVMFAKAEKASGKDGTIIIDKNRVFTLLESLNHEVYEAMDRYGESQASRELALQEFKKECDDMQEKASESAEEIYAASILYSDSTLKELEKEVERAREDIRETWDAIDRQLEERLGALRKNRRELQGQLERMEQSRIYLELIGRAKRREFEESEEQKRLNRTERQSREQEESGLTPEQKKIEIYVAEAYREKEEAEDKLRAEERKTEQEAAEQKQRTGQSGTAGEDRTDQISEEAAAETEQQYQADSAELDAEYFSWKEEINGGAVSASPEGRRGLKDIFKRVK